MSGLDGVSGVDYLAHLEADSAALAAAASAAGDDASVPSCPDWKVRDLVEHVTGVHRWVALMVGTGAQERIDRANMGELPPFLDGAADLVSVLRGAAPDAPVWNWSVNKPKVAAFWPRRMAHETSVHRWDAEAALSGSVGSPVATELAVDGIDEFLDTFLATGAAFRPEASLDGTLHLHCTDVEGEWLVAVANGVVDLTRSHGKGNAALRGTASDLLLFVWGRMAPDAPSLESFGDPGVFERWRAMTT